MLVSICCIACDIGDQTLCFVKDWSQCLCLIFAGVWVMFQVHMMCSWFIINLSKRGRLYPLGMVAGVYVDTQGEWSSPKSRGDWWPKGIGDKGKGWSVVEAQSMRCCAPDLKAHWGSLQAWTHTQSKLEEQSEPPDDPVAQWPVLLKVITSWSWSDSAEVEGRRRSLNKACEVLGELAEVSPQWNDDVVEVQASSPKEMEVLSTRLIMELSCAHHQA